MAGDDMTKAKLILFLVAVGLNLAAAPARGAGVPASINLSPNAAVIGVGETQEFTAKLLDVDSQETVPEANGDVHFGVGMSAVAGAVVDSSNFLIVRVTGKGVGTTTVRTVYVRDGQETSLVATSELTVFSSSGGSGGAVGGQSCAQTLTLCGIFCVDLATDQNNCGSCQRTCPDAAPCIRGSCAQQSPDNGCGVIPPSSGSNDQVMTVALLALAGLILTVTNRRRRTKARALRPPRL
jgi:hypothetical protein